MITISNLSKEFQLSDRTVRALDNVTLEIEAGEFFVLLGPSGSGKTTLVRCVAGLEHATSGEMSLGKTLVYSGARKVLVPPEQRNIGMVFQSYAVWPHLTVYQNIALPLSKGRCRLPADQVRERVARVLDAVELTGLESRPIPMLSGGQQQRVSLARALAVEPDALLMDEPLSNLDARLREKVRDQIRQLAKRFGITVLYVTHDQTEAMALADRIAVMEQGQVKQVGVPRQLYSHPVTPGIAEFFGEVNWLSGKRRGDGLIETPVGPLQASADQVPGDNIRLGIRPENIILSDMPIDGANVFTGQVVSITFLGERQSVSIDIQGVPIVLNANGARDIASGAVWVRLPPEAIMAFTP